ncbi:MAG: zinc-binding dehydrogenase [Rubrivivax sp.]|nr:zinc-binding dehydrogenase [Rubrivivax sp.]
MLAAAWARRLGATVIGTVGTVGSDDKAALAREAGCEHVIVTREYPFADAVQRLCSGTDVIVDGLGDAARQQDFDAPALCGHWLSLGLASSALQSLHFNWLVSKSITCSRPVVFAFVDTPALARYTQRLRAALADGSIRRPPIERYTLDAAEQPDARLESRATCGALIRRPDSMTH